MIRIKMNFGRYLEVLSQTPDDRNDAESMGNWADC